jgi:5'-methylthioadenosine/S-adenosylhomocysteine nucleosidase
MIVVIGAMDEEVREFLAHAEAVRVTERGAFRAHVAELCGVPVAIVKCGVGKVFAAMITQHVIDAYSPVAVISTGVAGGLSPGLSIGDVVVSRDCAHHDLDARVLGFPRGHIPYSDLRYFTADERLVHLAVTANLGTRSHKVVLGRILTGDQFIHGDRAATHGHLTEELEGDAVDMESAAIAQACHVNRVPFVSVRTLSDMADGSAVADFSKFLPEVASNSFHVVKSILDGLKR